MTGQKRMIYKHTVFGQRRGWISGPSHLKHGNRQHPGPNETYSNTHHLGNRQHPGPNENCSYTHHLKNGNRQHPGPNENCSDTHHLEYGNRQHPSGSNEMNDNCSDMHHLKSGSSQWKLQSGVKLKRAHRRFCATEASISTCKLKRRKWSGTEISAGMFSNV
jgi:hypothetical protein